MLKDFFIFKNSGKNLKEAVIILAILQAILLVIGFAGLIILSIANPIWLIGIFLGVPLSIFFCLIPDWILYAFAEIHEHITKPDKTEQQK